MYRIQASELGHGPRGPTPLNLDSTTVLPGTATEQVKREMKYLAAKLAVVQKARAHGKIQTTKIDDSTTPPKFSPSPCRGGGLSTSRPGSSGSKGGCHRRRRASPRNLHRIPLPAGKRRQRQPARAWRRDTNSWRLGPPLGAGAGRPGGAVAPGHVCGAMRCRGKG